MDQEVKREVELDTGAEEAWRAIGDESGLSEWLGEEVEADLVPGGEIVVTDEGGTRRGFVESVDKGRSIAFWWAADGEESSRVELEVVPRSGSDGCVVRVTETRPLVELERELADITACAAA
jgi:uncharacterized protein YndB with AHSA1/START domain